MPKSSKYRYGEVSQVHEGATFPYRVDLHEAGVHRPLQAGISGSVTEAAESIVVSGGYEDDEDRGNEIIYTGQGGNDPQTGKQVADQELVRGNMGLALAMRDGIPVRVVRGANPHSPFAPSEGYRYDGLFRIDDCWHEIGKAGFRIWRFRLLKIDSADLTPLTSSSAVEVVEIPSVPPASERRLLVQSRIIRNTVVAQRVKERYEFMCQVCHQTLETPRGPYAEAAHIKPLGIPHNGPDIESNILCLCPNHHVLFDYGAFTIEDDLRITGMDRVLYVVQGHEIGIEFVRYHREKYGETSETRPSE